MKKLGIAIALILFVLVGGFVWLVGQSSPENADSSTITIELPDNFEK